MLIKNEKHSRVWTTPQRFYFRVWRSLGIRPLRTDIRPPRVFLSTAPLFHIPLQRIDLILDDTVLLPICEQTLYFGQLVQNAVVVEPGETAPVFRCDCIEKCLDEAVILQSSDYLLQSLQKLMEHLFHCFLISMADLVNVARKNFIPVDCNRWPSARRCSISVANWAGWVSYLGAPHSVFEPQCLNGSRRFSCG